MTTEKIQKAKTMTLKGVLSDAYGKDGKNKFVYINVADLQGKTLIFQGQNGATVYIGQACVGKGLSISLPTNTKFEKKKRDASLKHGYVPTFDETLKEKGEI